MSIVTSEQLVARLQQQIAQLEPEEFATPEWRKKAVLFDIRDVQDAADGVIPGANLVTQRFIELDIGRYQLEQDQPIVICCYGGRMSLLAARSLTELGYRNVYSLRGGFSAWKDAGFPVVKPVTLDAAERKRYSRHLSLPQVGEQGQLKLKAARVAIVGAGGLGSPIALYLAAAGVGYLRLIDPDVVEDSNLQRQVIHSTATVGLPKVESARQRMLELNPFIEVDARCERLNVENAADLLAGVDIVIDGSDNFDTRYSVNSAIITNRQILVSASIFQFSGHISVFAPHLDQPCYSCLYPVRTPNELAPSCSAAGVIGALAGVVGLMQAMETIKLILETGQPLYGKMMIYDGLRGTTRLLSFERNDHCPDCGRERRSVEELSAQSSHTACGMEGL
ncbi:molybdopterin-synthase adenylyltransferase MoeB [Gynuella sunshinyii]|uniref:Molybdopterin-synthase adenylyltransferase n=1 Tax=Gynuella sunshinyii YC6258 TaxID=1445510 RepID=A0A0C5VTL1_9GAMM|nr:molybdopterin-synthase adenylyltransferase MoeB [Gynuella sunshinyii]AJQ93654.1 dinucleotide-utilizing enzyme involved in molybdopterin and thiamine biosynthesis family 2 [Gynuella sunshinyii YC6258]